MGIAEWALLVAVVGLVLTAITGGLAWWAAVEASRSNRLAMERNDVRWEDFLSVDGTYRVTNEGQDLAMSVTADVWISEVGSVRLAADRVAPGESIATEPFPEVVRRLTRKRSAMELPLMAFTDGAFGRGADITWRTPAGRWATVELRHKLPMPPDDYKNR